MVVKELGAVMFLDVYAEVLKFFDEFLSLSFAEHIFFRISDETYRELLVYETERRENVEIFVLVEFLDVDSAEIEEDFVREVEGHFLSESLADVVNAAVEHSGAEFKVGADAESGLQILVCGNAREHCRIIAAGRVARYAHIVEVEIVLFGIHAHPVECVDKVLDSLREQIFRTETVVDVHNEEAFVCRPFGKTSAVMFVACHEAAAVNVEEIGRAHV